MTKQCKVEGCETAPNAHSARGYCHKHYERWRKHGNPLVVLTPPIPVFNRPQFIPGKHPGLGLKNHCKYGHLLAGENLRVTKKIRNGKVYYERICKECHAVHSHEHKERIRQGLIKKSY